MKRYVKLWIVPLALVVLSYGAQNLAMAAWDSFVHFKPAEFSAEPGERGKALTDQVVIVVVDGLRVDAFNKMKYVSSLKERGTYFVLKTGQPSLSYPTWATIATGASQEITGVTTNWFEGPVKQDSIFSLATENGMTSYIVGSEGWDKLFGNVATEVYAREWKDAYYTFDEKSLDKALEYLAMNPNLLLVHFVDTDEAGHAFGGASPEYKKFADHIDSLIEKLHANMKEDAVLIVTADHGQIDSGGHGGWEDVVTNVPLVMVGKGIEQGDYSDLAIVRKYPELRNRQTSIAPTITILLGMPYLEGGHIFSNLFKYINYAPNIIEGYVNNSPLFILILENLISHFDNLPLFLVVLLIPLVAFWYARKKWKLSYKLPFLCSLLFFVIYYAIFFGSGKTISLSAINEEDLLQQFFNQVMLYAAVSLLVSAIVLSFLERGKERYESVKSTVILCAFVAFLFVLQIDGFFLYNGPLIRWHIPDMFLGFKYYLDMLALVAVGYASVVVPLASAGAHWFSSKLKI